MNNKVVLESSTNTHSTETKGVEVISKMETMSTIVLDTKEGMIVCHGHHHTVATEPTTKRVIKITQQEKNPITQAFQNAFD